MPSRRICILTYLILVVLAGCGPGSEPRRLVVVPDPNAERINVRIIFGVGAEAAAPGAAWMAARVCAEPHSPTADQLHARLNGLGIRLAGNAGRETMTIDADLPKSAWAEGESLIVAALSPTTLEGLRIDELRRLQHAELDFLRHHPSDLAYAVLWAAVGATEGQGTPPIGTDASIDNLTIESLKGFHARYLNSGNYFAGVSGPISVEQAREFDARLQALLPNGKPPTVQPPKAQAGGLNVRIVELPDVEAVTLLIGSVARHEAGDSASVALALAAAQQAAPGDPPGHMDHSLRLVRGLVDDIHVKTARLETSPFDVGVPTEDLSRPDRFLIETRVKPVNAFFTARILVKELDNLSTAGLSTEEITRLSGVIDSLAGEFETAQEQMHRRLAERWLGIDSRKSQSGSAASFTSARTRHIIRQSINAQNLWVIAVAPDGQRMADAFLSQVTSYMYPEGKDTKEVRRLDREYLAYHPFWQVEKLRSLRASEMFR